GAAVRAAAARRGEPAIESPPSETSLRKVRGATCACPPSMPRPTAVYNRRMAAPEPRRYHRLQLLLGLTRLVLGAAYLAAVVPAGGGEALAALAARVTASAAGQVALVAAALGAGHALLGLPFAWLSSWTLPRRSALLHPPVGGWRADRAKAAALGAALGLAGVEVVYALLRPRP